MPCLQLFDKTSGAKTTPPAFGVCVPCSPSELGKPSASLSVGSVVAVHIPRAHWTSRRQVCTTRVRACVRVACALQCECVCACAQRLLRYRLLLCDHPLVPEVKQCSALCLKDFLCSNRTGRATPVRRQMLAAVCSRMGTSKQQR